MFECNLRSIRRNICYGLEVEDGLSADEVPTTSDIEEAARLANAHDFIMGLPHGYETVSFYFWLCNAIAMSASYFEKHLCRPVVRELSGIEGIDGFHLHDIGIECEQQFSQY